MLYFLWFLYAVFLHIFLLIFFGFTPPPPSLPRWLWAKKRREERKWLGWVSGYWIIRSADIKEKGIDCPRKRLFQPTARRHNADCLRSCGRCSVDGFCHVPFCSLLNKECGSAGPVSPRQPYCWRVDRTSPSVPCTVSLRHWGTSACSAWYLHLVWIYTHIYT